MDKGDWTVMEGDRVGFIWFLITRVLRFCAHFRDLMEILERVEFVICLMLKVSICLKIDILRIDIISLK